MKRIHIYISCIALMASVLVGCNKQTHIGSFQSYEAECMGSEMDGSETILVWGTGKNKSDAIEQAKKNAVDVVLFKGITKGASGCSMKPVMLEVNARLKHEQYFDAFFKDGGEYKKYISMSDKRRGSEMKEKNKQQEKYGVVVRVLRSKLKEKLINDNILIP